MIGRQYEARKKANGASDGFRGNQYAVLVDAQNEHLPKSSKNKKKRENTTAFQLAEELGISDATVRRAEHFVQGLDAADQVDPGISQEILSGRIKPKKQEIIAIGREEDPEKRKELTSKLRAPKSTPVRDIYDESSSEGDEPKDIRAVYRNIEVISAEMEKPKDALSLEDVLETIRGAGVSYENTCSRYLKQYPALLTDEKYRKKTLAILNKTKKYIESKGV